MNNSNWQERWHNYKLEEYGKWKIGRIEGEQFIASLLEEERQGLVSKIEKSLVVVDSWASNYEVMKEQAEFINEYIMPAVRNALKDSLK